MRFFLNKILISCCFMLPHSSVVAAQDLHSCGNAKLIVSNFINSKQVTDWSIVEDNADKFKNCKCEMAPVFFYIYRMKVVLPNSQTLQGITPDDFISRQKFKMMSQVKILEGCDGSSYLPLIASMIKQDFDIEIAVSAEDLKKKMATKIFVR